MAQLVAFSLFGSNPKYCVGLLRNLELMHTLLPNWKAVVFCGDDVPKATLKIIASFEVEIIHCGRPKDLMGVFWRFNILQTHTFSHVLFRDTDSRFTHREVYAIQEWILSGKTLHIIRDHPNHFMPILAGMWGVTNKVHHYAIDWDWSDYSGEYWTDQLFLAERVYPILVKDSFIHDSFLFVEPHRRKLPQRLASGEFIGESFDESNLFVLKDREIILKSIKRPNSLFFMRWRNTFRLKYLILRISMHY
jgi:hypothetical protein